MLLISYGEGQVIPDTFYPEAMTLFVFPNVKTVHIHLDSLLESEISTIFDIISNG